MCTRHDTYLGYDLRMMKPPLMYPLALYTLYNAFKYSFMSFSVLSFPTHVASVLYFLPTLDVGTVCSDPPLFHCRGFLNPFILTVGKKSLRSVL